MDEQKQAQNKSDSAYDPKSVESRIYAEWQKRGFFTPDRAPRHSERSEESRDSSRHRRRAQNDNPKKSYIILLPPPNITGSLHMGHALNATTSDILIRYHRMKGYRTAWLPGIDHAGIAAQNVVEKNLRKENISRFDLGREKFVAKVWEWKEKYGNIILDQLKRIGASADWSRTRFTMDPAYSEQVLKAFIHYYERGLIYRGKRLVSWCPRCQTSLSDLEIEYKEETGKLYFIRYPLIQSGHPDAPAGAEGSRGDSSATPQNDGSKKFIIVATTRPETMLGDSAVAVNPKDKRYKDLIGRTVLVPLTVSPRQSAQDSPRESANREIPIIADEAVDAAFGTGMVKVTPAHDQLDSEIGARHNLPIYEVINERGRMQNVGAPYDGLKTLECREKVIAELQAKGLVEKVEDLKHNLAVCYRCNTALEPLLSNQWFLRMADHSQNQKSKIKDQNIGKSLRDLTFETVKAGKTKIIPKNFEKPFLAWLKNIKDWCISRQIWWGHRLPVWFHEPKCVPKIGHEGDVVKCKEMIVALAEPKCEFCDAKFVQSEDVLDTWFSSALWPFAGFSDEDIKQFYPSNVLITARDIINLWVGRMIFSGLEFMKKTPFKFALIHGTILTKDGKRMSKSLGTGIDPLLLIDQYGADATRFGIIWQAMGNQDIRWDEAAVMAGKKFANKIWNASRFVLGRLSVLDLSPKTYHLKPNSPADKKILASLNKTKKAVEKLILKYEFGQALHITYDFFWHEFCDVYLEASKAQPDENTNAILMHVLFESLKILHPFMPHLTEEIYQKLPPAPPAAGLPEKSWLIVEKW